MSAKQEPMPPMPPKPDAKLLEPATAPKPPMVQKDGAPAMPAEQPLAQQPLAQQPLAQQMAQQMAQPAQAGEVEGFNFQDTAYGGVGGGGRRSFTVMSTNQKNMAPGGTYLSASPMNAAKKAARQLFNKAPRARTVHFVLRETTRGSAKKTYKYAATKKKLDKPVKVDRGGVKYTISHEYDVKADKTA